MDGAGVLLAADFRKALVSGEDRSEKEHWNQEAVHRLPCRIDYDGPARVEEYFHPQYIDSDDETGVEEGQEGASGRKKGQEGLMEASFHGRRLVGRRLALPQGVTGVTLAQVSSRANASCANFAVTDNVFDHLVHWNHDIPPTNEDHLPKAFQWFDVANALHSPLEEGVVPAGTATSP
eukprot:Stramenopile-MAST_4_protein_220